MKNTLVIDLDRCSGCDSCVAACKMENQMNLGVVRNHVSAIGPTGTFPDIEMYWLPMQCQQCENQPANRAERKEQAADQTKATWRGDPGKTDQNPRQRTEGNPANQRQFVHCLPVFPEEPAGRLINSRMIRDAAQVANTRPEKVVIRASFMCAGNPGKNIARPSISQRAPVMKSTIPMASTMA